jgi:hypothetical protein
MTIGLGAMSFAATRTWTVGADGSISGAGGRSVPTDVTSGTAVARTSSSRSATLKRGSGLKGAGRTVTPVAFRNCQAADQAFSIRAGRWHGR